MRSSLARYRGIAGLSSEETIAGLARKELTPFSMRDLIQVGRPNSNVSMGKWYNAYAPDASHAPGDFSQTLLQMSTFLHSELPRRYARRVHMVDSLRHTLGDDDNILQVR